MSDDGAEIAEDLRRRLSALRARLKAAGGHSTLSDEEWENGGASVAERRSGAPPEREARHDDTARGSQRSSHREPLVDVFDEPDCVIVIAEAPGVGPDEIALEVHSDRLVIATKPEARQAHSIEVTLPSQVDPDSLRSTFTNGVLELRLSKPRRADGS